MSEIENHELKLKEAPFKLREIVESLQAVLEQTAADKQLALEVRCEQIQNNRLIGDAVRLKQVMMNLASNSLKFTPPGGKVSLAITEEESCRAGYAAFLLEVKDTGIGMNRDFVDSMIFKPFQRDETQYVSKTEGNGIGMSITKEILDVMGADMQIESEVGKGSVFRIHMSLKIDSGAAGKEQEEKSDVPNLTGKRLLVVEDNEINMEIIEFLLKRTEAEVVTAWNAEDALRIFDESPEGYFDLIFFDIQLPGMSGYEAVKILRAKNRGDALRVPVWAMTANAFSQDVEQSMQSGMNDHISKPIDTDVLYRKLKDAL
ncbi:MAG: response regulator [Lachnospiraceae bacterium]|nr:response regulator [Lachnospiraceae bacterium]